MSKNIKPNDNRANQQNSNKGNAGGNRQNAQVHGNRGKQMNPKEKATGKTSAAVGLIGGAALGAALGGLLVQLLVV